MFYDVRTRPAVVYYHGCFDPKLRETRSKHAKNAGAFGEAVLPVELLGLVVKALIADNNSLTDTKNQPSPFPIISDALHPAPAVF